MRNFLKDMQRKDDEAILDEMLEELKKKHEEEKEAKIQRLKEELAKYNITLERYDIRKEKGA